MAMKIFREYQPQFKSRNTSNIVETKRLFDGKGKFCGLFLFPYIRRKDRYSRFAHGQGIRIIGQSKQGNIKQYFRVAMYQAFFQAQIIYQKKGGKTGEPFELMDYSIIYYKSKGSDKIPQYRFKTKRLRNKRYNVIERYDGKTKKYKRYSKTEYKDKRTLSNELDLAKGNLGIYAKY